jgi:hypothetical protein
MPEAILPVPVSRPNACFGLPRLSDIAKWIVKIQPIEVPLARISLENSGEWKEMGRLWRL